MKPIKIYTYAKCSTCRKAIKWLEAQGIAYEEHPIRDSPPKTSELRTMLKAYDGELKKLFNTSGGDYRELKLGPKLPMMSDQEAISLLAENGNLVKRPFVLGKEIALVGFSEPVWQMKFLK
jgi:arsenate reductase